MGSDLQVSTSLRRKVESLKDVQEQQRIIQERLATGKLVSRPTDDPDRYFTASALDDRASSLSSLLDDMGQSIQTMSAADKGMTAIGKLLDVLKGKINAAKAEADPARRADYAAEYNAILRQIEGLAEDSSYNGKNLLGGVGNNLKIVFDNDFPSVTEIKAIDYTNVALPEGLALDNASNGWANTSDLDAAQATVNKASERLKSDARAFATDRIMVENRGAFTKSLVNALRSSSDRLTAADMNEEGAKLLALQTRQSLQTSALSLSNGSEQNILRLFGG